MVLWHGHQPWSFWRLDQLHEQSPFLHGRRHIQAACLFSNGLDNGVIHLKRKSEHKYCQFQHRWTHLPHSAAEVVFKTTSSGSTTRGTGGIANPSVIELPRRLRRKMLTWPILYQPDIIWAMEHKRFHDGCVWHDGELGVFLGDVVLTLGESFWCA